MTIEIKGGEEEKVWRGVSASEVRIGMMRVMIKQKIAFADLEELRIDFQNKIKSKKYKEKLQKESDKVTEPAMKLKLADEQNLRRELVRVKLKMRRDLQSDLGGEKSKKYKDAMSHLKKAATETKDAMKNKYKTKIKHIKEKYRRDENEDVEQPPEGLEDYAELSVFSKTKYDRIEVENYEVKTIGEVTLSDEEKEILRLHPKFSVMGNLKPVDLDGEQEASLAKIRMEMMKEKELKEYTPLERKENEEIEAEGRMVFNPKDRVYDGRKRRVTDLKECARVTLPKHLSGDEESRLEVRKRAQKEMFEEYIRKNTTKNGEQRSNLTKTEQQGLKSLQKRIKNEEILIMKTDKSSKFVVTTPEEYVKMGEEHTKKDEEIEIREVKEMEKIINNHTIAWSLMWNSGENHDHVDRIVKSKVTRSGNQANLSLLYKDHKEGHKTRPVASGNESFNLGLSNGVSEVMEAVTKGMSNPYSVISSEDMMARLSGYNKKIEKKYEEWMVTKSIKLCCRECSIIEKTCNQHEEFRNEIERLEKLEDWEGIKDLVKTTLESKCCQEVMYREIAKDCNLCGKGLKKEDVTMCLIGSDVVALYPSLSPRNTGEIVKNRIEKSNVKFEGFDEKKGLTYIRMNEDRAGNIEELEHLLPKRVSNKGSTPTMAGVTGKWNPEKQWEFSEQEINNQIRMKIIATVTMIALVTLFENFSYKFGGKNYKQKSGGPIGVRATGAASNLIMEDWAEEFLKILENSGLWVAMAGGYVDDGRKITSMLEKGSRFDENEKKFILDKGGLEEDARLEKVGESNNEFMARILIKAMNSINKDLTFTTETPEHFEKERLPTLDFELWMEKETGKVHHSYFQKQMKTPFILMARSAMCNHQKIQINSNELTRRLFNINIESVDRKEIIEIVEQFIKEVNNSGYNQKQAKEMVCSGLKGWQSRFRKRKRNNQNLYRLAKETLDERMRKELTEKENWFKVKNEDEESPKKIRRLNMGRKHQKKKKVAGKGEKKERK